MSKFHVNSLSLSSTSVRPSFPRLGDGWPLSLPTRVCCRQPMQFHRFSHIYFMFKSTIHLSPSLCSLALHMPLSPTLGESKPGLSVAIVTGG